MMKKRLIIYDSPDSPPPFREDENTLLISASPGVRHCIGCFSCWLKTPGRCVINDRGRVLPSYISQCNEIIIISPVLYGGYSRNIKAVIDRSIGYVSPFFQIVDGEMHHKLKIDNPYRLRVCFYGPCDKEEQEIARELVRANAVNLGAGSHEVFFLDAFSEAKEAIQ